MSRETNENLEVIEFTIVPKQFLDKAKLLIEKDLLEEALELLNKNIVLSSKISIYSCIDNIDKIVGYVPTSNIPTKTKKYSWRAN